MRLPTPASPGAAARRSLLFDGIAALAIALVAIAVSAGIGVVGFFALPAAVILVSWFAIEGGVRWARRGRARGTRINAPGRRSGFDPR